MLSPMGKRGLKFLGLVLSWVLAACRAKSEGPDNAASTADANAGLSRLVSFGMNDESGKRVCHGDAACLDGERCFGITKEFGICAPRAIPEATECTPRDPSPPPGLVPEDECGCGDSQCEGDRTCRSMSQTCSCIGARYNSCVELPCKTDMDCGDDICIPSTWIWGPRCIKPTCRSDADCNEHPGMRCVARLDYPTQRGEIQFHGTLCVYNERPDCVDVTEYAPDAFGCR
jgi:hypothetical protein